MREKLSLKHGVGKAEWSVFVSGPFLPCWRQPLATGGYRREISTGSSFSQCHIPSYTPHQWKVVALFGELSAL